jgi:hypothetical protein
MGEWRYSSTHSWTRCYMEVSFTSRSLYPQGWAGSRRISEEKNSNPCWDSNPGRPTHTLVAVLTELSRLQMNRRNERKRVSGVQVNSIVTFTWQLIAVRVTGNFHSVCWRLINALAWTRCFLTESTKKWYSTSLWRSSWPWTNER